MTKFYFNSVTLTAINQKEVRTWKKTVQKLNNEFRRSTDKALQSCE